MVRLLAVRKKKGEIPANWRDWGLKGKKKR